MVLADDPSHLWQTAPWKLNAEQPRHRPVPLKSESYSLQAIEAKPQRVTFPESLRRQG